MDALLEKLVEENRPFTREGRVAGYIPELAKADRDELGICVVSSDGRISSAGEYRRTFTIQSIIKPILLLLALMDNGEDTVRARVGVEATGKPFDAINYTDQALLSDPDVILQSYGFDQLEQRGKLIRAYAPELGAAYGEEAQALLDGVLEDIAAGRLGVHTLGGAEDDGVPKITFQWKVYSGEDEPPYYGMAEEKEISVALFDTASSTLAVMERLIGQNG